MHLMTLVYLVSVVLDSQDMLHLLIWKIVHQIKQKNINNGFLILGKAQLMLKTMMFKKPYYSLYQINHKILFKFTL